jgi:hypothetical protein
MNFRLSRGCQTRLESGDLGECVRQVLFLMRVAHPGILFEDRLPQIWSGPVRPAALAQALTNIVKNATEGIAAHTGETGFQGKISVAVAVAGRAITIDVIDNGKGFPKENRQRLLEPYMTTRADGTGQGLPIVAKIIADRGGGIELRDAPSGRGAWVRLFSFGTRSWRARLCRGLGQKPCLPKPEREGEEIHGERYSDSGRRSGHTVKLFRDIGGRRPWHAHGQELRRGLAAIGARRPTLVFLDIWLQGLETRRLCSC